MSELETPGLAISPGLARLAGWAGGAELAGLAGQPPGWPPELASQAGRLAGVGGRLAAWPAGQGRRAGRDGPDGWAGRWAELTSLPGQAGEPCHQPVQPISHAGTPRSGHHIGE